MKRLWLLVAAGFFSPLVGCSSAPPPGPDEDGASLPPEVASQIEVLLAEKASRTPAERKIASQLLYAKSGRFADATAETKDPAKRITPLTQSDKTGRVLVDVKGDMGSGVDNQIRSLGGDVVGISTLHGTARAWMPLDKMVDLASNPAVHAVRPAFTAAQAIHARPNATGNPKFMLGTRDERVAMMQRAAEAWQGPTSVLAEPRAPVTNAFAGPGAALSEGVKAHGADTARKFYGADGSGVTVGVLSDSDDGREQSIATGDLPPDTVSIPGQDGRPGSGEGTAMMEIVHDMAPGAKIVFATAFNSPESFADNIRRLHFEFGANVICDDIIYFFESPYQDDIIAQAVNDVVADGAVYVSSAGNEGNISDGTSGTWEGDFKGAGSLATLPSGYTVHDFGSKVISNMIEATGGPLIMHWSDPGTLDFPQSSNDYDLFLLDGDLRNVVLAATDLQDGAGLPFEFLGFNIPPGFRIVVAAHPNAEKRAIRVELFRGELGLATTGASYGHNQAAGAMGAAAVDAAEAGGGVFTGGATTPVELYSADGPRRVFNNPDGTPIHGGRTFASGGGELRKKPDVAAADGVSTTLPSFSGLNPFFGTSAAAPHVAGIAAMIKGGKPGVTGAQITDAIRKSALDIEAAGRDNDSGGGLAMANAALAKAGVAPAVFLEANTITVTPAGSDVVLPGGSATVRVQLINNGGAAATAVSATLTSTSPNVQVSQPFSTYPNVFPGGTGTNPSAFAFSVNPAAPCGARLPLKLTINYTGKGVHPLVIEFSVQTGRPDSTFARTSYAGAPVAIPDASAAGVDIPLAVTGAPISRLRFSIDGTTCSSAIGSTTVGVDHTWVGDLTFRLTAPSGKAANLIVAAGGAGNSGNNFCQTVLDDTAASSIQAVTVAQAPFTGTFKAFTSLDDAFGGEDPNGTWTLNVADNAFFDTGSVRAFSVETSGFTCTP